MVKIIKALFLQEKNFLTRLRIYPCCELILFFLLAVGAYFSSLLLIFPGYIAPLAAHHSDIYIPVELSANYSNILYVLSYPRCILMVFEYLLGMLGFKACMTAFIILTFINTALVFYILETFYLLKRIPLFVIFLSQLVFFSLPGYYISNTHDIGATVAGFFALLGVLFLEAIKDKKKSGLLFALCCLLSGLSKENFLPALEVYILFYIGIYRPQLLHAIVLAVIPVISFGAAYLNSCLTSPAFINFNNATNDSYFIVLAPCSLFATALFYLRPFLNIVFLGSILIISIITFFNKKLLLLSAVFLIALACYSPYLLLPNHKFEYYWWSGMPILICILPICFYSQKSYIANTLKKERYLFLIKNITILAICFFVLYFSRSFNRKNMEWYLNQQDINRNIIQAIDNNRESLQHCRNIFVSGISFPFYPWSHPNFFKNYLNYFGKWGLLYNKNLDNYHDNDVVTVIRHPSLEQLREYDRILIFNTQGKLVKILNPAQSLLQQDLEEIEK